MSRSAPRRMRRENYRMFSLTSSQQKHGAKPFWNPFPAVQREGGDQEESAELCKGGQGSIPAVRGSSAGLEPLREQQLPDPAGRGDTEGMGTGTARLRGDH